MSRRYLAAAELRQPPDGLGPELRTQLLLGPVLGVLRAADQPLSIGQIRAELPGASHGDVKRALFRLRYRGLVHGRTVWAFGCSPHAKRPLTIKRLEDAA